MKRIVICCDGTWNRPGKSRQTNVSKLYDAVLNFAADGTRQVRWYDKGVGTEGSLFDRLRGGAFGHGLGKNVQDAYTQIVREYEPGDHLYLFGFSRGAYTARSTLGMVRKCGVLRPELIGTVREAWAFYKNDLHPSTDAAKTFRRNHSVRVAEPDQDEDDYIPRAKLIGVWDTVGSLGVPVGRFREKFQFHDVALTSWVQNGFQALAIDERRKDYAPALWEQNPDPKVKQRMEQRWFAGVHSDVGGGAGEEGEDDQSDRCLRWIIERAREQGLEFDEALIERTVSPRDDGKLHLEPGLLFSLVNLVRGTTGRDIGKGVPAGKSIYDGKAPSHEAVDPAVLKRQDTGRYHAPNVDAYWAANPAAKEAARREV
ncbi:MAG TPA: DUF2235 domain-containing protein [Dehalococcoidia bacterium]|jgi:uncharacterized protein (DUF2235 family)